MNYSPKLRQAMEEIKAVLKKHDIAGVVVLHSPGYGEHYTKLSTSYSAIELVQKPNKNGELEDYGAKLDINDKTYPDPEKRKQVIVDSINTIEILHHLCSIKADNLEDVSMAIHKALKNKGAYIENTPGKHTDSREIDN